MCQPSQDDLFFFRLITFSERVPADARYRAAQCILPYSALNYTFSLSSLDPPELAGAPLQPRFSDCWEQPLSSSTVLGLSSSGRKSGKYSLLLVASTFSNGSSRRVASRISNALSFTFLSDLLRATYVHVLTMMSYLFPKIHSSLRDAR